VDDDFLEEDSPPAIEPHPPRPRSRGRGALLAILILGGVAGATLVGGGAYMMITGVNPLQSGTTGPTSPTTGPTNPIVQPGPGDPTVQPGPVVQQSHDEFHLKKVEIDFDSPLSEYQVIVKADGVALTFPTQQGEWFNAEVRAAPERLALPPGPKEHHLAIEIVGKDGGRYRSKELVTATATTGEMNVKVYPEAEGDDKAKVEAATVFFELRPLPPPGTPQ